MSQSEPITAAAWAESVVQRLSQQRERLHAAAALHRQKAAQWEGTLQEQLAAIEQALQKLAADGQQRDADIDHKLALLKTEQECCALQDADLGRHRAELEAVRQSLEAAQQAQLGKQQAVLDELSRGMAQLQQREAALANEQAEIAGGRAEVEARRRACDDAQRVLAQRDEAISRREAALHQREASLDQRDAALQQRDETLRGREAAIGQRSDAMRDAERAISEHEARLAEKESELKLGIQRMRSQRSAAGQQLRARRKEFLAEMERQQAEAVRLAAGDDSALGEQLKEARREIVRLKESNESSAESQLDSELQLEQVKKELLDLQERLLAAESRSVGEGGPEAADLQKRLEMALSDMRELKNRNTELTDQISQIKAAGHAAAFGAGGDDWESRKQRMLAQLESDFDENDPAQKAGKLTVEQAIQRTEEVVAAKNHEITELQRLLSEQSGSIGGVAIGASAIAEMLDSDDLVRQERESLRELQERLREQLKQAEIDLSVERAKVARERAILEEKIREFEQRQQQPGMIGEDSSAKGKPGNNRGRWLQRLGLRDDEQK